jgi:hypothetical protein
MGEFDDKSGKGFQDNWQWPDDKWRSQPPRVPNVVGKFVLLAGVAVGLYAYFAAHWGIKSVNEGGGVVLSHRDPAPYRPKPAPSMRRIPARAPSRPDMIGLPPPPLPRR